MLQDDWDDKFIPTSIKSRVLQYNPNMNKREEYTAKLNSHNHKSKLYHTISVVGLKN